eukprot:Rhum_TRINITY_DN14305_c0_g1::Rhum_TRINITY_DN14305_c0_g1_i1::g.80139::m.80139
MRVHGCGGNGQGKNTSIGTKSPPPLATPTFHTNTNTGCVCVLQRSATLRNTLQFVGVVQLVLDNLVERQRVLALLGVLEVERVAAQGPPCGGGGLVLLSPLLLLRLHEGKQVGRLLVHQQLARTFHGERLVRLAGAREHLAADGLEKHLHERDVVVRRRLLPRSQHLQVAALCEETLELDDIPNVHAVLVNNGNPLQLHVEPPRLVRRQKLEEMQAEDEEAALTARLVLEVGVVRTQDLEVAFEVLHVLCGSSEQDSMFHCLADKDHLLGPCGRPRLGVQECRELCEKGLKLQEGFPTLGGVLLIDLLLEGREEGVCVHHSLCCVRHCRDE